MNKKIRSLIDDIFAEMKMSAENLALRDELMANAQARFDDEIASGRSEEEALREVASSLGNVHALLQDMNAADEAPKAGPQAKEKPAPFWSAMQEEETPKAPKPEKSKPQPFWSAMEEEAPKPEEPEQAAPAEDPLGKAMSALGDFGQQLMPQMEKIVRKADSAMGGMVREFGKAVTKGVRDVSRAAGDAFGRAVKTPEQPETPECTVQEEKSPERLRKEAAEIRAQAELKQATGDQEGARDMRRTAYEMETRADEIEREAEKRRAEAEKAAEAAPAEEPAGEAAEEAPEQDGTAETQEAEWLHADGEIDHEAFAKAVDDLADQAEEVARETHDAAFRVHEASDGTQVTARFPAMGLQQVAIDLDADDVEILAGASSDVEVTWEAGENGGDSPVCRMDGHTLTIRRHSDDLFKSFFSVFSKDGGRVLVRVPQGYAASYRIRTTSGDITVSEIDADEIQADTTSGSVRITPDAGKRLERIGVGTVSGPVTVSAQTVDVACKTVTGDIYISCDAVKADADSVSGKVHIEGACDTWEVNTVSGEVELLCTVVPAGKITVGTVSATARLALPDSIRGFVAEASGPNAAIVNEFGPNRYGTCQLPIRLETLSGRLVITRL